MSPIAVLDPSQDEVITQVEFEALCEVLPGNTGAPIAPESVTVSVLADDKVLVTQNTTSEGKEKFKALLSLRDVPAGPVSFVCSAADTAMPPHASEARIDTFLDRGPSIGFVTPTDGSAVAASDIIPIVFSVEDAPLSEEDDKGSAVDLSSIELRVNGMPVQATPDSGNPRQYTFDLDFKDTQLFPGSMVQTVSLEARAKNLREPHAAEARSRADLVVDAAGPAIKLVSPLTGSIVGGEVQVVAEITDALSGVDPSSVRFEIPHDGETISYPLALGKAPQFTGKFQAGRYAGRAQLTINVVVRDNAGIESRLGVTVELDTVPPWVSLDPPPVRVLNRSDSNCSNPFDPLGDDAAQDGSIMAGSDRFRMLVWERGIASPGATVVHLAGVENPSVALYIQGDPSVPLIIDTDGDGVCDAINATPSPASKGPVKLDFSPLTPMGGEPRVTDAEQLATFPPLTQCTTQTCPAGTCKVGTPDSNLKPLCTGESPMYSVIGQLVDGTLRPAVYALQPASGTTALNCTGRTWQTTLSDGWACVAGTATDRVGNVGISSPIRVCYGPECLSTPPPPSCTDSCSMPGVFVEQGMPRVIAK